MTTQSNIHPAANQAVLHMANNAKERLMMTIYNNVRGIKSLVSNTLRNNRATKVLAGLIIGGTIASASMLPGIASADGPAKPLVEPQTASAFIPASAEYQTFALWEFPRMRHGKMQHGAAPIAFVADTSGIDFVDESSYQYQAQLARSDKSSSYPGMDFVDESSYQYQVKLARSNDAVDNLDNSTGEVLSTGSWNSIELGFPTSDGSTISSWDSIVLGYPTIDGF